VAVQRIEDGDAIRPADAGLVVELLLSGGYWIARSSRAMTVTGVR
jgi:hypothetical protein